jgi:formyl-CoA transferase
VQHNDILDDAISAWTSQHDLEHVLRVLDEAAVPNGKIYTAADIYDDAHYRARDMIEPLPLTDGKPIDLPGIVPKLSETPGGTRWLGPELGAHTEEILASLGIRGDALVKLRAQGVV